MDDDRFLCLCDHCILKYKPDAFKAWDPEKDIVNGNLCRSHKFRRRASTFIDSTGEGVASVKATEEDFQKRPTLEEIEQRLPEGAHRRESRAGGGLSFGMYECKFTTCKACSS